MLRWCLAKCALVVAFVSPVLGSVPQPSKDKWQTPEETAAAVFGGARLLGRLSDAPEHGTIAANIALLRAIGSNDVAEVRRLIAMGVSLHADGSNPAPLEYAIEHSTHDLTIFRSLLDAGATLPLNADGTVASPLPLAVLTGRSDIVEELLQRGHSPFEPKGQDRKRDLLATAREYCVIFEKPSAPAYAPLLGPWARAAVGNGPDHEQAKAAGITNLMAHAYLGDATSVQADLDAKNNPNAEDNAGWTALHWAAAAPDDRTGIIRILTRADAVLTSDDKAAQWPLSVAAAAGNTLNALELLPQNHDAEAKQKAVGKATSRAIIYGHKQLALSLMDTVALPDDQLARAARWSTLQGDVETLTSLIKRGFQIKGAPKRCEDLLVISLMNRDAAIVKLLLDHNAPLYFQDRAACWTAFDYLTKNSDDAMFDALFEAMQKEDAMDAKTMYGRLIDQALYASCAAGKTTWCQRLIDAGANAKWIDERRRRTLLSAAAIARNGAVIRLLLDHGADIKYVDPQGDTVLSAASRVIDEETIALLVQAGADPTSSIEPRRNSPMTGAIVYGNTKAIRGLVRAGVDIQSDDGETFLTMAIRNGRDETVRTLLELGVRVRRASIHAGPGSAEFDEMSHLEQAQSQVEQVGTPVSREILKLIQDATK